MPAIERYKRFALIMRSTYRSEFIKILIDFLGLQDQAKKFGIGTFDIKLYRLAKVGQKVENYRISTQQQQQLDLEFGSYSDESDGVDEAKDFFITKRAM